MNFGKGWGLPAPGLLTSPPNTGRWEGNRDKESREEEGGEIRPDKTEAAERAKLILAGNNMPQHAFTWLLHGPFCLPYAGSAQHSTGLYKDLENTVIGSSLTCSDTTWYI